VGGGGDHQPDDGQRGGDERPTDSWHVLDIGTASAYQQEKPAPAAAAPA
jgi:hypothetical protein